MSIGPRIQGVVTSPEDGQLTDDLNAYLAPGRLVDSGTTTVVEFARRVIINDLRPMIYVWWG